mmetsp:Transcript_11337/g.21217  ORF Transcript_11337/g.21217 Transcript_11337/m.21217 type:complete len:181 (+) Transcript_11337:392-934(+)
MDEKCNQSFSLSMSSSDFSDVDSSTSFLVGIGTISAAGGTAAGSNDQYKPFPASIHVPRSASRYDAISNAAPDILMKKQQNDGNKNDTSNHNDSELKQHGHDDGKVTGTAIITGISSKQSVQNQSIRPNNNKYLYSVETRSKMEAQHNDQHTNEDVKFSSTGKRMRERRGNGMFAVGKYK